MSVRRNNLSGHDQRNMSHGVWYKRKSYKNQGFRQVPNLSIEERQEELNKKLKPYSLDLAKHIPLEASYSPSEVGPEPTPQPTPTPSPTPLPTPEYLVVMDDLTTYRTTDFSSFSTGALNTGFLAGDIAYSPTLDRFIVGEYKTGTYNRISYSDDGLSWTDTYSNTSKMGEVGWNPDQSKFFSTSYQFSSSVGLFHDSVDGINWVSVAYPNNQQTKQITWYPSAQKYLANSTGGYFYTSPSGDTWTTNTGNTSTNQQSAQLEVGGYYLVVHSGGFHNSTNLTDWTYNTSSRPWYPNSVDKGVNNTATNKGIVIKRNSSTYWYTSDGLNWNTGTFPVAVTNALRPALEWDDRNSRFIMGGNGQNVYTSTDMINWSVLGSVPGSSTVRMIALIQ